MLNIYFEAERMKYPNTGIYEYCGQLGRSLATQLQAEEQLYCYVPAELEFAWGPGTRTVAQRSWHRLFVPRQRDASVWHATYQQTRFMPGWRVPRILTIHDLNFLYEQRTRKSLERNRRRLLRNVGRADHLVAISRFVAEDIARHVPLAGKTVQVIYNGVDTIFDPAFDDPTYRPERPFCFTIGPTIPKKNFHVLPCLLRGNDFELVIAGSKRHEYSERIMQEAKRHKVADRVKIIGFVSHEEKFWYFRNCSAFLFPSIAEGFGMPIIEAMRLGKKVFASNQTSLPEIGGRFANYFETFDPDAMSEVFASRMAEPDDPSETAAMIEHAEGFNWTASARQYLELYRSVAWGAP